MAKRPSLGRGLAALLPGAVTSPTAISANEGIAEIPLDLIDPNPYQPRLTFDPAQLQELAASIRVHGVLQAVLVVPLDGGRFSLVAGERRVQASRLAGRDTIPAQVRHFDDRTMLAVALVENVQRAELDPIEKARALARLKTEFGATQEELAREVGMARPSVANLLRLLDLPESVQVKLQVGSLTTGHAKVLMTLDGTDLTRFAETCVAHQWSVRELEFAIQKGWIDGPPPEPLASEARARQYAGDGGPAPRPRGGSADPDLARLEQQLSEVLGTPCKIRPNASGQSGTISFQYYSLSDSDRLIRKFLRAGEGGGS
ncbi:MAG: ParB/RepB/Spo0J family partition protein [bacterium]